MLDLFQSLIWYCLHFLNKWKQNDFHKYWEEMTSCQTQNWNPSPIPKISRGKNQKRNQHGLSTQLCATVARWQWLIKFWATPYKSPINAVKGYFCPKKRMDLPSSQQLTRTPWRETQTKLTGILVPSHPKLVFFGKVLYWDLGAGSFRNGKEWELSRGIISLKGAKF